MFCLYFKIVHFWKIHNVIFLGQSEIFPKFLISLEEISQPISYYTMLCFFFV